MFAPRRSGDSAAGGVLLASRSTQKILSELEKFPGTFYVNVNNADAFFVSMIYSKASIFFLCLIGTMTAINTLTFSSQLTETNVLCRLNDLLPIEKDLRQIVIPIAYYCRCLEMSIAVNILQLVFCLFALLCALNRRSYLFLLCYSFLGLMLLVGLIFLIFILSLNFEDYISTAVNKILRWILNNDSSFCQVLEPILNCRIHPNNDDIVKQQFSILIKSNIDAHPNPAIDENSDVIEFVCGINRNRTVMGTPMPSIECADFLTSFLMKRHWLISLVMEYGFVILMALAAVTYGFRKKRRSRTLSSCGTQTTGVQPLDDNSAKLSALAAVVTAEVIDRSSTSAIEQLTHHTSSVNEAGVKTTEDSVPTVGVTPPADLPL